MSEVGKLPKGWEMSRIGEVCEPSQYGYTAKAAANGNYHYLRTTDITKSELDWDNVPFCEIDEEEAKKYLLQDNDIVISRAGSIGYSCLISKAKKSVFASYLIRFRPLLNPKYFRYFLDSQHYWNAISQGSSGIAVQNVNAKTLSLIDLPIAPEKEQQRIVEKLDEAFSGLDSGIKELKATQVKLIQQRQSLLKSAVEGSLTQQWREVNSHNIKETGKQLLERILKQRRVQWQQQKLTEFAEKGKTPPKGWQDKYPEPVQPDTSELPELPEGWVWATIDQLTMQAKDITDGPFGSNLKTEHYTKSGPRVIRLQNIGDGEFLDDKAHISEEHFASLSKHAIECDDILVAMMGELLPRACLVPSGVAPAIVKADCARIRVNTEVFTPKLLSYYLNSNPTRNRTKSAVKGIGRPRINLAYIRSIVVPLPSIIEQKAITDKIEAELDLINRQIEAAALGLKQSEAQRKNILKLAFSGQLVPQDPNDEPASVLLEKIKAEHEALAKTTKPRTSRQPKKRVDTMDTLLAALTAENGWIDAQEAFKKCGIVDGASTDRIEEIYSELRQLEKAGRIEIKRSGDYDQLRFIK